MNTNQQFLPCEVVFAPEWWHHKEQIIFDRGFFFDPKRRVRDERRMRDALARRFSNLRLGDERTGDLPVVGPVHLAAGYIMAEAMGCEVSYHDTAPPSIAPMNMDDATFAGWEPPELTETPVIRNFLAMLQALRNAYGWVEGDVNWSGIHNLALDLRGNQLFLDYYDMPDTLRRFFDRLYAQISDFIRLVESHTGTTSISVNRSIRNIEPRLHVHSNCTVTMLSPEIYKEFLLPYEKRLAQAFSPYGIHHCGNNAHLFANSYAQVPNLAFVDVGWGSDVAQCRQAMPETFLNIRISPTDLGNWTPEDIQTHITRLARSAAPLERVGFCCINLDHTVPDQQIHALFDAVDNLRKQGE